MEKLPTPSLPESTMAKHNRIWWVRLVLLNDQNVWLASKQLVGSKGGLLEFLVNFEKWLWCPKRKPGTYALTSSDLGTTAQRNLRHDKDTSLRLWQRWEGNIGVQTAQYMQACCSCPMGKWRRIPYTTATNINEENPAPGEITWFWLTFPNMRATKRNHFPPDAKCE